MKIDGHNSNSLGIEVATLTKVSILNSIDEIKCPNDTNNDCHMTYTYTENIYGGSLYSTEMSNSCPVSSQYRKTLYYLKGFIPNDYWCKNINCIIDLKKIHETNFTSYNYIKYITGQSQDQCPPYLLIHRNGIIPDIKNNSNFYMNQEFKQKIIYLYQLINNITSNTTSNISSFNITSTNQQNINYSNRDGIIIVMIIILSVFIVISLAITTIIAMRKRTSKRYYHKVTKEQEDSSAIMEYNQ